MYIDKDIENLKKLTSLFETMKRLSEENIKLNTQKASQEDRDPLQEEYDAILFSDDLDDVLKDVYLMMTAFIMLGKVTKETVKKVRVAEIDIDCLTHQFCC